MLSLLYQVKTGAIRMHFDNEGRDELLLSLKIAIKERDHDFLLPDTPAEGETEEWQVRDFLNIICLPDDKAPLCVEDGVELKGGAIALAALAEQLQPPACSVTIG
jgi:hypothetical protein